MTDQMDDNGYDNTDEMSFAELFESYDSKSSQELTQGDMVDGEIIAIGSASVYVDTGTKSEVVGSFRSFLIVAAAGSLPRVVAS